MDNDELTKTFKFLSSYYVNNCIVFDNLTIDEFSVKMTPFIHIVEFWTQALGLLLSKCNDHKKRKNIINNLYDENCNKMTHVETFYAFLIECSPKDSLDIILLNAKNNLIIIKYKTFFNNFILNSDHSFETCSQMLAGAEYIYSLIGDDIKQLFLKYKYVDPQYHFNSHDIDDTTHSTNLFECSYKDLNEHNILFGADWMINVIKELLI